MCRLKVTTILTYLVLATNTQAAVLAKNRDHVPMHLIADSGVNAKGWTDYGNWCGANHGGFQDCCSVKENGTACRSCKILPGQTPDKLLTDACLQECPPVDELDRACAWHDACTFSYPGPKHLKCVPQGNFCACDCMLVQSAKLVEV